MEREPAVTSFISGVVAALVRAAGLDPVIDEMGNLTAQIGSGQPPRRFLLTYAMTHAAAGMTDPYTPRVLDGGGYGISGPVVRGRGACEQKGPLAATLDALRLLAADGEPRRGALIFACCTAGETGTHDAARGILAQLPGDIGEAVVAVGTDGDVWAGNKGRIDITVTIRGKASHSSSPGRGAERHRRCRPGPAAPDLAAHRTGRPLARRTDGHPDLAAHLPRRDAHGPGHGRADHRQAAGGLRLGRRGGGRR